MESVEEGEDAIGGGAEYRIPIRNRDVWSPKEVGSTR